MDGMSSFERVMTVVQGGIPDRVPVDLHNFLTTIAYARFPMDEALHSGEMLAEAQLRFWRDFGHDMLLVENGVCAEAEALGCTVDYPKDGPPRVVGHVLAGGLAGVAGLAIPDFWKAPGTAPVLRAVQILRRELGNRVFVMGRADQAPASLAGLLRGYETFILDMQMAEEPQQVHALLDFCAQVQSRYMQALGEAGAHGTSMGEMGVDIIGPRLYRTWANSYDRKVVSAVNRPGYPVSLHICGNATLILGDMVATGAPILELDYKTGMAAAKAALRGKATFLGPVNPELIWSASDPAEVDAAAREAIEVLAPGGGLILGPGCALGHTTPADNIHALIQAARKYGIYRPNGMLQPSTARPS